MGTFVPASPAEILRPAKFWFVLLSIAALVVLLARAEGRVWHVVSFAVYGTTLVLLYAASAMAHSIHCSPRATLRSVGRCCP